MSRKFWLAVLALASLGIADCGLASAATNNAATSASKQTIAQKSAKKLARRVDPAIASCKLFGSDGRTPRPALTHMKQGDHARIRAEYDLIQQTKRGNGDEAVYYEQLTGDRKSNPKLGRFRVGDSLGMKKGCTLTGVP